MPRCGRSCGRVCTRENQAAGSRRPARYTRYESPPSTLPRAAKRTRSRVWTNQTAHLTTTAVADYRIQAHGNRRGKQAASPGTEANRPRIDWYWSRPMKIALASPRVASSVDDCLDKIKQSLSDAAAQGAEIACFPEAYLPGLRGLDFEVPPFDETQQERA